MREKAKNVVIILLCVVIAAAVGLTVCTVRRNRASGTLNPNVTLVAAPEQTEFEVHPEWVIPEPEPVDYGENIALEKQVKQDGQTDVYNCRNITDGDRFTYWEGKSDAYPNQVTIDMEKNVEMTGARILLNPRAIWSARTQEVEVQVSSDNETFVTVYPRTALSFDPMADNSAYMPFDETAEGQYIRFVFYANTGAKGGQAAEIEVYGP